MKRLLTIIAAILVMVGCRTQKEAVTWTTHDTVIVKQYSLLHDSVYIDRFHDVYVSGDTVYKTDSIFKFLYKYEQIHDTLSIYSTDTLTSVKTVTTPAERSGYDKFVSWGFWILLFLIIAYAVIRVLWAVMKSLRQ